MDILASIKRLLRLRRFLTACLLAALTLPAQASEISLEYQVKAAYLAKFGDFINWSKPGGNDETHQRVLCIAGVDPFDGVLESMAEGEQIGDRSLVIRRIKSVNRNSGCDILYLGELSEQSIDQVLDELNGSSVLTVTDAALGNGAKPGIIDFIVRDNRVRFNIDDAAAARNGITISSHLLNLALSVKHRS